METTSTLEPTAEEVIEIRAEIRRSLAQMEQIHQQIVRDQIEIDQLKQETQEIVRETRATAQRTRSLLNQLNGA